MPQISCCKSDISSFSVRFLPIPLQISILFQFPQQKRSRSGESPPHKSSSWAVTDGRRWTHSKKRTVGAATSRPILVLTSVCMPALGQHVTDQLQSNRIPSTTPSWTGWEQRGKARVLFWVFQILGSTKELWPQSSQYIESTQHRVKGGPQDFPGSPFVKTLCFHHRGHRFNHVWVLRSTGFYEALTTESSQSVSITAFLKEGEVGSQVLSQVLREERNSQKDRQPYSFCGHTNGSSAASAKPTQSA